MKSVLPASFGFFFTATVQTFDVVIEGAEEPAEN